MKDVVSIDKNYDRQFYPRDLFEGLGLTDTKDLAEVAMFVLHGKEKETKTDIAICDDFIQFTTIDNKSGFSAIVNIQHSQPMQHFSRSSITYT